MQDVAQYAWIAPGMTIKVHLKIKDFNSKGEEKERIQIFEGRVIARKGNNDSQSSSITVRKISNGVGVEKIFPLSVPSIAKIEPVKKMEVRKAKLYYLRTSKKKIKDTVMKTA